MKNLLFIALPTFVFLINVANAQTLPPPERNTPQEQVVVDNVNVINSPTQEVVRIATVNIQNASLTQSGNKFDIAFDISNREGVQPGIKLGVLLTESGPMGEVIVDQKAYPEEITLGAGEVVSRNITYTSPKVFAGDYKIYLIARNSNGFPFGQNLIDNITLPDIPNEEIEIDASQCEVFVKDDIEENVYGLQDGVDINPDEAIGVRCLVVNNANISKDLVPNITTYQRTPFGELVETVNEPTVSIKSIGPNTKEKVEIILPTSNKPQSYDVVISFGRESNSIIARYVIRGGSATIQNAVYDRSYYFPGDNAKIKFIWSPAADNFRDSRTNSPTILNDPYVTVHLTSDNGVVCGSISNYPLPDTPLIDISIPIISKCGNPRVSFVVSDNNFGILDKIEHTIPFSEGVTEVSPDVTLPVPIEEIESKNPNKNIVIGFIVLLFVLFLVFLVFILLKRKNVTISIALGFIVSGAFFANVGLTQADTFVAYTNGDSRTLTYTINAIDSVPYNPGQTISLSATGMTNFSCGNSCSIGGACRGAGLWVSNHTGGGTFPNYIINLQTNVGSFQNMGGSLNITAAATPGAHSVEIRGTAMYPAIIANGISMNYTVAESTGTIIVTSNNPGATWTFSGPSGTTFGNGLNRSYSSMPTGTYTITWGAVAGFVTPPSSTLTLTAGGTLTFPQGNYTPVPSINLNFN